MHVIVRFIIRGFIVQVYETIDSSDWSHVRLLIGLSILIANHADERETIQSIMCPICSSLSVGCSNDQ